MLPRLYTPSGNISEKAAAPSRTSASGHIIRTMNNARRLPVRTDAMPSLAMVLSGDTCYPVRLVSSLMSFRVSHELHSHANDTHCSLANFEAYLIHKARCIRLHRLRLATY